MSAWQVAAWALPAVLAFWCVGAYNRLVRLRSLMAQAFVQVDVQLRQRHELVPRWVEAMRPHAGERRDVLDAVAAASSQAKAATEVARTRPTAAGAITSLSIAEQVLGAAVDKLMAIAESAPELKADASLQALPGAWVAAEHRLAFSRQLFNDAVLGYNHAVQQFPTSLLAPMFGFKAAAPLQPVVVQEPARTLL